MIDSCMGSEDFGASLAENGFIKTTKLIPLLETWASWYKLGPQGLKGSQASIEAQTQQRSALANFQILKSVTMVERCLSAISLKILGRLPVVTNVPILVQELLISKTVLQQSLLSTLQYAQGQSGIDIGLPFVSYSPFVTHRWLFTGRCPRQAAELGLSLSPVSMLYACQIPRTNMGVSHGECTSRSCKHARRGHLSYTAL